MILFIFQFIFLIFILTAGYNIDLNVVTYFTGPSGSYFGYQIGFIHTDAKIKIVVSAPRNIAADMRRNLPVFICDPARGTCEKRPLLTLPPEENQHETGHWFGVTMEPVINRQHEIMICSHLRQREKNIFVGYCYLCDVTSCIEFSPFSNYKVFETDLTANFALTGISTHQTMGKDPVFVMSAIGLQSFSGATENYHGMNDENPELVFCNEARKYDFAGYSITSGRFIPGDDSVYIVVGAPRRDVAGMVFTYHSTRVSNIIYRRTHQIKSQEIGEYFGACVASVSIGKINLLLVGAPMYAGRSYDEGRVYIFRYRSLDQVDMFAEPLTGSSQQGARFGSAIVEVGDLDLNNYPEVAIGAPYEDDGRGAVYIYYGYAFGIRSKPEQIIRARDLSMPLSAFGASISRGIDLDNNGYPDLVIGSFLSDQAVLFRSKPIVQIRIDISSNVKTFDLKTHVCKNKIDECFKINICFTYRYTKGPDYVAILFTVEPDTAFSEGNKRIGFKYNEKLTYKIDNHRLIVREIPSCPQFQLPVILAKEYERITDFSTPFQFKVNFSLDRLYNYPETKPGFEAICPSLQQEYTKFAETQVQVNAICKETICRSDLKINVKRKNFEGDFIKPSDLEKTVMALQLRVDLIGEPALSTYIYIETNGYIESMQALSFKTYVVCNANSLSCFLGNLIDEHHSQIYFDLSLNIKLIDTGLSELMLNFVINSSSHEEIPSDNSAGFTINIIDDVDIFGYGSQSKDAFCEVDDENKCYLYFAYRVQNHGEAVILQGILDVKIPQFYNSTNHNIISVSPSNAIPKGCSFLQQDSQPMLSDSAALTQKDIILSCSNTSCTPILSCKIDNITNTEVFQVTFNLVLETSDIKSIWKNIESLTISTLAETRIMTSLQPKAMQLSGHQPDNFQVNSSIKIFKSLKKSTPFPLIPVIVGAATALLILIIIIMVFIKCGFFERKDKEKIKQMQSMAEKSRINQIYTKENLAQTLL